MIILHDPLTSFGGFLPPLPGSPPVAIFGPGGEPAPVLAARPTDRVLNLKRGALALRTATRKGGSRGVTALHKVADSLGQALADLASKLVAGTIRLATWFTGSLDDIVSYQFGGLLALTHDATPPEPALVDLEARINQQAGYLTRFRSAIADGLPMGPGLIARAASYGDAVYSTAMNVYRGMQTAAKTQERRFLGESSNHCAVCPAQAAMGWQPVGTLLEIGDSPCGINCRCRFSYR